MIKLAGIALCAVTLVWSVPTPVQAEIGVIERACRQSSRPAANKKLCRCIQGVARKTLSRSERIKAAKFFKDPHMAQVVRQSNRPSDETLWKHYKAFGQSAAKTCG